MPIQAVETRRLYRQIADQLVELIAKGEYQPGERLPPERDLAVQLGVSRPSVREALIALEVEGHVEVRVGSGVYVTGVRAADARQLPADSGPFELLRARWLIESECAALAAREGTAAQLRAIQQAYEQMISLAPHAANERVLDDDSLFHLRIAEASNNSALVLVVRTLWEQRMGPLFMQLENHFTRPETWPTVNAEHRAVLEAIQRRDAREARNAMRRHMDNAARRFNEGFSNGARTAPAVRKSQRKAR